MRAGRRTVDPSASDGSTPQSIPQNNPCGRDRASSGQEERNDDHQQTQQHRGGHLQQELSNGAARDGSNEPGASGRTSNNASEKYAKRTTLQAATLNINGFGNLVRDHPDNKWGRVYKMMSEHRLGVLMLQETHLTDERVAGLHKMFAKRIRIFHSANPESPTQREGVAVVLNSRYVNTAEAVATVIIPGRAIQVAVPGQGRDTRTFLCVYAPTSDGVDERKRFFREVRQYYDSHPSFPRPQIMAGDFNNVEDALDRLPVSEGPDASIMTLDDLKLSLGLMIADGWRATHPNDRAFSFHRGSGMNAVFSRLDRIYVSQDTFNGAREWVISEAGVKTDHSLVSVQLTSLNSPVVGPGRPVFPLTLLKDKKLAKAIKSRGLEAMNQLADLAGTGTRTDEYNPQIILYKFKKDVMKLARDRERAVVPKLLAEIRNREHALKQVLANTTLPDSAKTDEAAMLTKQIRQLRLQRYKQQQQNSRATHRLYGDRPSKYWSKLHRECSPRDIVNAFEKEGITGAAGEKVYESESVRMADMARTHHMNIQKDEMGMKAPAEREEDISIALNSLDVKVTGVEAEELGGEFTYDEIELSLRYTKNGTASGLDGIPFELWKAIHARHIEDSRFSDRVDFDVVRLLRAAFEDIRLYGVNTKTAIAHGWIAPIYKEKGERTRIVNYRPITILNTDYKLLTKALAVRLAVVAPDLINRAQAGFVPGRRIHNHTQLARTMMSWAETNEADGAIVALDQEKAYDKIAHDYLWRVLQRFGIPDSFINLVKSMYANAVSSVMINGVLSKAYRIYRGVRQGDPLSCLLFDLAIEPLSAMIRKSALRGFGIPRCNEVLKAVLFADDTTVYLSSQDDFGLLQEVLDTWCSAAKARFNMSKTEIIPIGSIAFRTEMAETYRATGSWKNYPRGVHVAQEGEAVRMLGAFFGNGVSQIDIWTMVLTKIVAIKKPLMHALERWKTGHAPIQGKKHVVQMIVGGMTQFFTTVQRMPDVILKRLNKIIGGYLWDDRRNSPVGLKHLYLPIEQGGLGLLDLSARSEAIDVMWLKAYLNFSSDRPLWAFLVDDLLATHVPKNCTLKQEFLRTNPFLQKWSPKARGLPDEVKGMISVAKKFGLRLEGLALSRSILNAMPMWDHIYADRKALSRLTYPSRLLTCLQSKHGARSVSDFVKLASVQDHVSHIPRATCECQGCASLRMATACENPHLCSARAREMVKTLPSKWNPCLKQPEDYEKEVMNSLSREQLNKEWVPFDRRITTYGDIGHAFRIFTGTGPVSNDSVAMELQEQGPLTEFATDGSCFNNGERNARAGAGVFVHENHVLNRSLRVPMQLEQSNQTGELAAALLATTTANPCVRVLQVTDSQTTLDSVTKWRQRHEDEGYILTKNSDLTQAIIARLRMRKAHTLFKWVKGHAGHPGNEAADRLAALGAAKDAGDHLDTTIPLQFAVTGAKLQSMTQKLAYRAIRSRKNASTKPRPRAAANLDRIVSSFEDAFGTQLLESAIWSSLHSRHVTRGVSQFMWRAVHDAYMIGSHWLRPKMPEELQRRAYCAICGECEDMSHIVLECEARGQQLIWSLLKKTWAHTRAAWKEPTWGSVFGAACVVFKVDGERRSSALESLWCILCTEALHLIWKLRCERVIQNEGEDFSESEVTNRYYATMNSRLNLDRRTAAKAKGKRALKPQDVERIWSPVLEHKDSLPPMWVVDCGVLVSIERG